MRIVFLGTPAFAVPALEALAASAHEIAAVFTRPDRPAGRGRALRPPPVKERAEALGLEVRQPEKVRSTDIAPFGAELAVVVAYGQYLSRMFLAVPPRGVLNLHPSLLPRWRGAAPIQRALLAGDRECGACVIRVVPELDAGPVLGCVRAPIGPRDTTETLHDVLAEAGGRLMVETIGRLERGEAEEAPQDESRATYAEKLTKGEARIDWSRPAEELDRRVRGLRPWPVAETIWPGIGGGAVRIWSALPSASDRACAATPATVLGLGDTEEGKGIRVKAGRGELLLLEVQPPGGKRMGAKAFAAGHPFDRGLVLGEGAS